MKKIISLILVLLMAFSLCACGGSDAEKTDDKSTTGSTAAPTEAADPNTLLAGFARVQCIPDDPLVHIAGGTASEDPATDGLLDTLEVTCVALKRGDETYLIYTCDIVDIIGFNTNIDQTCDERWQMPTDTAEGKLLVSVHYYDPWSYAGASTAAGATAWGTKADFEYMDQQLAKMTKWVAFTFMLLAVVVSLV